MLEMNATTSSFIESVLQHFKHDPFYTEVIFNQAVIEMPVEVLLASLTTLKDTFHFEQLVDATAVDLLTYGEQEWKTTMATDSGFSRGFQGSEYSRKKFSLIKKETKDASRFAIIYQLLSIEKNERLSIKVQIPPGELLMVPSVVSIWSSANWYEREIFDMFGIHFTGHDDLRRILTDYGFIGHPFRKDFPLVGEHEVRYDPELEKVIQQPVSIEPRVLVPKVIRSTPSTSKA